MKKILLLLALLVATSAQAQSTRSQATANLMGLGMPGPLASEVAGLATGLGIISNNTPLKWINATGSAVPVINLNDSNQLELSPGTTDAADNGYAFIAGGGDNSTTRGAYVQAYGNEDPGVNDGDLNLNAGNVSGGNITLDASNTAGTIILLTNSTNRWIIEADGDLTSQASGGDLNISALGKTISIQESTPGSACMGTFTANGATPVVVSTTCAATNMRTFFTKTSTSAVNGSCYRSALSNGVSFTVTCLATDTGTYDWFIIKEAP